MTEDEARLLQRARELEASYCALQRQLADVVQEFGLEEMVTLPGDDGPAARRRREILDRLARGDIDARSAAEALAAQGGK